VPVSLVVPPKVSRSTVAAQSLESVKVLVQPEKDSLDAIATALSPRARSGSERAARRRGGPAACTRVRRCTADRPVRSARWSSTASSRRRLDQFVGELGGQRLLDTEAGYRSLGAERSGDGLAGAGVPDQAQRLALLDPLALGQDVDDRGIDAGVGLEVEAAQGLLAGNLAAVIRRSDRRRARSSHSASSSSARNPR
jgi:hypothetical protein